MATALFKRGFRIQAIQDVHPLSPNQPTLVGEAFTLRYIPAREDLNTLDVFRDRSHPQRKAIEDCPPGAVMVMDSRKDARAASAGAILVTRLMKRGVAGVVTDGGFRDSAEIAALGFPAYHHRPSAPTNLTLHQAIDINVPIGCGDAPVFPGRRDPGRQRRRDRDPRALGRRDRRRGVRDDGLRGLRHRACAGRLGHLRPLSGDRSEVVGATSQSGGRRTVDR